MKRALITGGSGAIGAAISRQLSADGMHVIVHANSNLGAAQALCADLARQGMPAEAVQFDVTDPAASLAALEALLEAGPI
jgi:3-oxoacyl-[acyl-carrier protein] reductase